MRLIVVDAWVFNLNDPWIRWDVKNWKLSSLAYFVVYKSKTEIWWVKKSIVNRFARNEKLQIYPFCKTSCATKIMKLLINMFVEKS